MKLIVGLGNPGKKYEETRHNVGFMMLDSLVEQIKRSLRLLRLRSLRLGSTLLTTSCSGQVLRHRSGQAGQVRSGQAKVPAFAGASAGKQNYNLKFKINEKFQADVMQLDDVLLAKPQTYMNRSGVAVGKLVRFYKVALSDLYVVHDDLDIPLGKFKIQQGKGPRVHGGLRSIYEALGTEEFWHVRLGIENRFREIRSTKHEIRNGSTSLTISSGLSLEPKGLRLSKDNVQISNAQKHLKQTSKAMISGEEYVLQHFAGEEQAVIRRVIEQVVLELVVKVGRG